MSLREEKKPISASEVVQQELLANHIITNVKIAFSKLKGPDRDQSDINTSSSEYGVTPGLPNVPSNNGKNRFREC